MRFIFIILLFLPGPVYAGDRGYAKDEDACLKSLVESPGSETRLLTFGQVNGFAYSIDISRAPQFDEDDATLKKEAARLRERLKDIEGQIAAPAQGGEE